MSDSVVTKKGICLLNPATLTAAVKKIEEDHPGWWWSLSQRPGKISLSLGPGRNGPSLNDLKLAFTHQGDSGFHYDVHVNPHQQEEELLIWLSTVSLSIKQSRNNAVFQTGDPFDHLVVSGEWYRKQSDWDLDFLNQQYSLFLSDLPMIEDKGHLLSEIYLGACDTTADCSLRGTRADHSSFDVSVDIADRDKGIGDSLHWSLIELKDDILTTNG
jgi:hypothetical protein